MIIATINRKGGVGKTTTALNLGAALAQKGHKVLLVDLDPQGSLSALLDFRQHRPSIHDVLVNEDMGLEEVIVETYLPNLDLVPGNDDLTTLEAQLADEWGRETLLRVELDALASIGKDYEFILVDTPPSGGLHVGLALVAADIALIALAAEEMATEGLPLIKKTIGKAQRTLNSLLQEKVLITMFDSRLTHCASVESAVRTIFANAVYETMIPRQVEMERPVTGGGAVVDFAPTSTGAAAYCALAEEVLRGQG